MNHRVATALLAALALLVAACGSPDEGLSSPDGSGGSEQSVESGAATTSAPPPDPGSGFPTDAFADISDAPFPDAAADQIQEALAQSAGTRGVTATVMTARGTWSGAVGTADGEQLMDPDAQMAIASVTKTAVAAQVMQLVEDGDLALDDPAADHLPTDLGFDTNGATVRQLLSMRSGIPNYTDEAFIEDLFSDRLHQWTAAEILDRVPDDRASVGGAFEYSNTNYFLLGLMIEELRQLPLAQVLRSGVLTGDGLERMVFQPDESLTEPLAMPSGESRDALVEGGGYLPSLAGATAAGGAGAIASDAASAARWWASLCQGEVVSDASLAEMTAPLVEGQEYGLGLKAEDLDGRQGVGHDGMHVGFTSWAGCVIDAATVIVVLANDEDVDGSYEVVKALVAATDAG